MSKEMDEFPELGMTIGEYYKLLVSGKRPTRQRTAKEEPKSLIPGLPPKGALGVSQSNPTTIHSNQLGMPGLPRRDIPGGGLGRSHSESGGGRQQSGANQSRRKNKLKNKLRRHTKEGSGGNDLGVNRQQRSQSINEERKFSPTSIPPFLQSTQQKPKLQQMPGGVSQTLSLNPTQMSQQENPLSKLRHRSDNRHHQHHHKPTDKLKKKKDRQKVTIGSDDEGMDPETKTLRRDEVRKAIQMGQKFEMVEVHPLYGAGRFACLGSHRGEKTYDIKRVKAITSNQSDNQTKFEVAIEDEERKEHDLVKIDFDQVLFSSRVFLISINHLPATEKEPLHEEILSLFQKVEDKENCNILLTQLVSAQSHSELPKFAVLLPSTNKSSKDVYLREISIEDPQVMLKNLNDLDDHETAYEQFISENKEHYKSIQLLENLIEHAKNFNQAFYSYENATSKILISPENLEQFMFTQCLYTPQDSQTAQNSTDLEASTQRLKGFKQGVFLRAKFDNQHNNNEHLLFIKKLGGSTSAQSGGNSSKTGDSHKETRSEWLQISKFKVLSDVSRGYISTECLTSFNSDGTLRLKKRNIKYIGYRESLKQRSQLRLISNEAYDCENGDIPRRAPVTKDSQGSPGDRCSICFYQAQGYDHLRCSHCNKVFHEQCCLEPSRLHQLYLGVREELWRCQDCIRCVNCLGMAGRSNAQQLLVCRCCNSAYHFECLDPNVKMALPNAVSEGGNNSVAEGLEFHCERCVQCEQCGSREAGKNRMNKWSKDFKLCSSCNKKRKKKQFCTICDSLWPEELVNALEAPNQTTEQFQQSQAKFMQHMGENFIQCGQCKMSVHYKCDRIFEDPEILKKFKLLQQGIIPDPIFQEVKYHCPDCRQQQRQQLIYHLICRLSAEDKYYYFQDPVEDQIPGYTKIIKTPMCFQYLRDRARTNLYLQDPSALRRDVNLIFENAMKFNLPKHKVHKEAQKLGAVCTAVVDSVQGRLEINARRSKEEDRLREWLRRERKRILKRELEQRGGKILRQNDDLMMIEGGNNSIEDKHPIYQLSNDELFDVTDHPLNDITTTELLQQTQGVQDREDSQGDFDDNAEEIDDDLGDQFKKPETNLKKRSRVTTKTNANTTGNEGEQVQQPNRFSSSSKRARFNQTQQSSFSVFSANLLTQAMHQHQEQIAQNHHSADQALINKENPSGQANTVVNLVQQQQQLMMNYYQEIDDERCYYSNPARCSFDDPCLAFEEMCYLCGSFGKREDFLSCTLCGESFHTYCLQLMPPESEDGIDEETSYDQQELIKKFQGYWKCLNCKFCEICSSATQEAFLLYCDVCDKAFHSFCLSPQLSSIPKCQWKCQECFKCTKCHTTSFFDPQLHQKPNVNGAPGYQNQLQDTVAATLGEFEFSQNFSLCYECGQNEHKKSFCKICQQSNKKGKNGENGEGGERSIKRNKRHSHALSSFQKDLQGDHQHEDDRMLKCKTCGFYCHIKCSRLLPQSITELSDDLEDHELMDIDFKCLECLLAGKSINHLIRETCESYENMHQIIARQRLLTQLVSDMITPYIPKKDKAPIFIKAFIEQNEEFFRKDKIVSDWLSLLETGVVFQTHSGTEEETATSQNLQKEQQTQKESDVNHNPETTMEVDKNEEQKLQAPSDDVKVEVEAEIDSKIIDEKAQIDLGEKEMSSVYKFSNQDEVATPTQAEQIYEKMYGYKETFLPPKRNLYDALASEQGYHRFGQRELFIDPFSPETQGMITIPLDENLQIDYAQLYIQIELKAVMRVKLHFFSWFEQMVSSVIDANLKRLNKKKQQQLTIEEEREPNAAHSHELASFIGANDPPSAVDTQNAATNLMCTEEDVQIDNPQKRLQCIMCKLKGELTVTGRLIPFQVNQFVHVNCALWSTDVHEIADGGYFVNFFQVWTSRAKFTRCWHCNEPGASLFCFSTRHRCMAAYHFPCAYRNRKMSFAPRGQKETFCEACCKGHRGLPLGLPSEYKNTKRRFQIAKNMQPWNMTHHTTSLTLQQQSLQAPAIQTNGNSTSAADIEKPLMIEKWRPYFFDMFNRVGNLTVLSLRKEINQIIEEHCTNSKTLNLNDMHDFSSIRIYWNYFPLNGQQDDLKDVQMLDTDQSEAQLNNKHSGKQFFLYHNEHLRLVAKNDLEEILPYVSTRIKDKVNLGLHYMGQDSEVMKIISERRNEIDRSPVTQRDFWTKLMKYFTIERPRFSLNNIIFSITEFTGKTKYPVSIWNRVQDVKNKTFFLRSGEQVLQAQGNIGSGGDKENPRDGGQVNNGSGPVLTFGSNPSTVLGKKGESSLLPGAGRPGAANSIDEVFRRMTKINQMGDHQNPMASIKRVNASKHMQYEQVLHNLGKKMFYKAPPPTIFEEPNAVANTSASSNQKQKTQGQAAQNNAQAGASAKGIQKKIRQTDSNVGGVGNQQSNVGQSDSVSKESDLPIAMKYRLSKTQPKRVEVGPSKIHRNGLFTHEDLAAGDIVIEYVGERIRNKVADKREIVYEQKGIGDCYLFRLDKEYIIDATFNGNKARYLNHSCDANCSAKIITVQAQKHIIICANRAIKSGEELTYNYNFDYEADKIECFCGAPGCLGRLN